MMIKFFALKISGGGGTSPRLRTALGALMITIIEEEFERSYDKQDVHRRKL